MAVTSFALRNSLESKKFQHANVQVLEVGAPESYKSPTSKSTGALHLPTSALASTDEASFSAFKNGKGNCIRCPERMQLAELVLHSDLMP
eukprot:1137662-Pelagomonas_calceolata.AAC.8